MRRNLAALVVLATMGANAWGQAADAVTTPAAPSAKPVAPADIDRWIIELGDAQFRVRESAQQQLRAAGVAAIPALIRATKSESAETTYRAAELLATMYRTVPFPEGEELEETILAMRNHSGSIGDRTRDAWDEAALARNKRTVPQLEALGAIVRYREPDGFPQTSLEPQINYVVISEKWTGNDEQLCNLLARLSPIATIQVYHVNGSKMTEEEMLKVSQLGYKVERRGAFLGIRNGRELLGAAAGCEVGAVTADSPAAAAGLKADDMILACDDEEVIDFFAMIDILQKAKPGDRVMLTVKRNGQTLEIPVVLGNW